MDRTQPPVSGRSEKACRLLAFLQSIETVLQIGQNIINVLGTDGQPDGVGLDTLIQQLLSGQLGMSGSGRRRTMQIPR